MTATALTATGVLDAVRDLLPSLRERAQETEDLRRIPDDNDQGPAGHRLLPAAAARAATTASRPRRSTSTAACGSSRAPAARPAGCRRCSACTRGSSASSTTAPSRRCGATTRRRWSRPRTRRWAGPRRSTAGSPSAAGGASRPAATTRSGSSSAASSWATDGTPVDFRTFLLPRADYEIDDVWDTIGLRGTGSNDIIVKDVFVPEYRTLSFMDTGRCFGPGQAVNDAADLQAAVRVGVLVLDRGAGARHGPGRVRRLRGLDEGAGARLDRRQGGRRLVQPDPHRRVGRAARRRRAADRAQHRRGARPHRARREDPDRAAGAGAARPGQRHRAPASPPSTGSSRAPAAARCAAGTPIQRFWRDAHAGRVHAINDPEKVRVMFGQFELGLKIQDAWL